MNSTRMQSVLDEVDDGISYFYHLLLVAMLSLLCFHLLWSGLTLYQAPATIVQHQFSHPDFTLGNGYYSNMGNHRTSCTLFSPAGMLRVHSYRNNGQKCKSAMVLVWFYSFAILRYSQG